MADLTVAQAVVRAIVVQQRRRVWSRSTARERGYSLAHFARTVGPDRAIGSLTKRDVQRWVDTRGELRATTRRTQIAAVRAWLRWLVEEGLLETDPSRGITKVPRPQLPPRALTVEQVRAVLDACPDARATAIVWSMAGLGLRCSEVAGLQVHEWDRYRHTVRVLGKGQRVRVLHVPGRVAAAWDRYLGVSGDPTSGPLIRSQGLGHEDREPVTGAHVSAVVAGLMRSAGIKRAPKDGVSAHALRHHHAVAVLEASGQDLRAVQSVLGHADLSTTAVYLRGVPSQRVRDAVDQAAEELPPAA